MSRVHDQVKERRWLRLLREKQACGESVAAFCGKRRIPIHQFYWWQRKLSGHAIQEVPNRPVQASSFVPVRVPCMPPTIEIVHPSGCVIRVIAGVDVPSLRNVFDALERGEA